MPEHRKRIGIVGAGPGGLTSAMILAHRGFDVTVFERGAMVGGRNAPIRLGPYTFDTGPTFLMMRFILDEMFEEAGRRAEDLLSFTRLDPLYRLVLPDGEFRLSADPVRTREALARRYPGNEAGFDKFMATEGSRFEYLYPCLQKDYGSFWAYMKPIFLKALPHLSLGRWVFGNLGRYFAPEELRLCFAFQTKYLGMSPWSCPGFFTMLSYVEHAYGIYHVRGGLNAISLAMAQVVEEDGGCIRTNTEVQQLWVDGRSVRGVILAGGEKVPFDDVIVNADFGEAMPRLIPPGVLRKYTAERMKKWKVSCSTFMLYLGVNRAYPDLPHHNIVFARDYQRNLREISEAMGLSDDPSLYVQNASVTDPTLAPPGKSTIYILVPVPNNRSRIPWDLAGPALLPKILEIVETRGGFTGLRKAVEVQKVVTPADWQKDYRIFEGATFNLAHTLGQMLYLRPRNRFEELDHCYLVGGGTHPGSGLPTIYESARISSNLLCRTHGVAYKPPSPLVGKNK